MTDLGKKIIFEDKEQTEPQTILSAQQLFDEKHKFNLITEENSKAEQEMALLLKSKKPSWALRFLAVAGVGLTAWQSVDAVLSAALSQNWLSLGSSAFFAGIAALGIGAIGRELYALRHLKGRQDTRTRLQALVNADGIGKAKAECEKLAKFSQAELNSGYDKWQNALAETHNDKEVFELYDSLVLAEQDRKAAKLVANHAIENAVMVAVSPLAVADMLLVAWRSIYLIENIAKNYGVTLGYWSRIRLLRLVLRNMAIAGVSEVAIDAGADLLSVGIAGKISARAGQGIGIGLLTARLGFKTIELMRPLPYINSSAPKLADVRKAIVSKLAG